MKTVHLKIERKTAFTFRDRSSAGRSAKSGDPTTTLMTTHPTASFTCKVG
ncbi:MAG: hypothetical protein LBV59_11810 [Sphingobacterium sp.]|jgi:hypothetical protein|nr:hypothetical protein [Sphingobacterium sp.]MDR3008614.1 hypothetical protein [Sphingobacterium sp.]